MSLRTRRDILKLVDDYLKAEEEYRRAASAASINPAVISRRNNLRIEIDTLIRTELYNEEPGKV